MRLYVSGPVVDVLDSKRRLDRIYMTIEKYFDGHVVELPLRSRDLDTLPPGQFYKAVYDLIKSSDGVVTVLTTRDQSGPVEATIASVVDKPQCIMEMAGTAPRLLRGLPNVVDITLLKGGPVEPQVHNALDRFNKNLGIK
jgi:hypothetical protein